MQRHYFANKGPSSQGYGFSSSHVWMWVLDCEESWAPKNWCFWTVVLEKTLESPLDCKETQWVHPKGDQSWVFIGRTDFEAENPILWPPDAKNWLIWKDPDVGKEWRQEEKGITEDEMVGWHHRLDGHAFGETPGDGDGQGGLARCRPWGCKESDTAERLNWSFNTLATWCIELTNWKDPDPGKNRGQEKGVTEDEMVRCHHWLNVHEFEDSQGDSDGQKSLECCISWGHKELDTT